MDVRYLFPIVLSLLVPPFPCKVIVEKLKSTIDDFGVETSWEPFDSQPSLYLNITYDLFIKNPDVDPLETAEALLNADLLVNTKLKNAWDQALELQPNYTLTELAALAYSLQEPEFMFRDFNDVTSAFRDSSNYDEYYYKGLFALLLLPSQPYYYGTENGLDQFYRGVSYVQEAIPGQYIRFNRFLSTSKSYEIAQQFAGESGSVFIIPLMTDSALTANFVAPYSIKPEEEEYLVSEDAQFLIADVQPGYPLPNGNRTTLITMIPIDYIIF